MILIVAAESVAAKAISLPRLGRTACGQYPTAASVGRAVAVPQADPLHVEEYGMFVPERDQ
jgi:hypothetical protein